MPEPFSREDPGGFRGSEAHAPASSNSKRHRILFPWLIPLGYCFFY